MTISVDPLALPLPRPSLFPGLLSLQRIQGLLLSLAALESTLPREEQVLLSLYALYSS
jgi:hypothetical protein